MQSDLKFGSDFSLGIYKRESGPGKESEIAYKQSLNAGNILAPLRMTSRIICPATRKCLEAGGNRVSCVQMINESYNLRPSLRSNFQRGFSLVELLCVIAIVSILASASWPSIMGILSGDQLTNNVYQLSGLVQQARTTAVTQHTYVWVGFYSYTKDGSPAIMVASISGNSGLSTDLYTNNYRLSSKLVSLKNVKLAAATDYNTLPGYDASDSPTDAGAQTYTFSLRVPGNSAATFASVITFG